MEKLIVKNSNRLNGIIKISGSKNASLPIMAATLLSTHECLIKNIPELEDIKTMINLLKNLGVKINKKGSAVKIDSSKLDNHRADYDLVRKMRASILVLGPLLARKKKAIVSLPGGCAIGTRPIDLHLFGMKKLGAKLVIKNGYVFAEAPNGLKGNKIVIPQVSVGATENIILASTLAKGRTIISNAATEPEIQDMCNFLNKMGAKIKGIGKRKIEIYGVKELKKVDYNVIPDRIVAGTFMIAALITKGNITIKDIIPEHLKDPIRILKKVGAEIKIKKNSLVIDGSKKNFKPVNIITKPYPGFPTDLQAQLMSLLVTIKGTSSIQEKIFENRFIHVSELNRLGAKIKLKKDKAYISGVKNLVGAPIMASDLRASVSLVLAGLAAQGKTTINRIYHIDRGYEKIENKLNSCGASIKRFK